MSYVELSQHERAIKDHDESIRLDPQRAFAYRNRALTYTLLGKEVEARQDIERAVELGLR